MQSTRIVSSQPCTLITGATGFLGHYVLAELLRRRLPCVAIVRPPLVESVSRLEQLLSDLGVNLGQALRYGALRLLEGDLARSSALHLPHRCSRTIHCAASTRFTAHESGEPTLTNVQGTANLLNLAARAGIHEFHHISTAFVCGRTTTCAAETVAEREPDSHNEYERSKWESERLCVDWSRRHGARLTIHRPSIIVGAFDSGRATKFDGFYLTARATELIERRQARAVNSINGPRRQISLRVRARAQDPQNIVPVDWVARMITAVAIEPTLQGRTYHLVNPAPPTNRMIQHALEEHFGIAGSTLVAPEAYPTSGLNAEERIFGHISRPIAHYMVDTPHFDRTNVRRAESHLGLACPTYDTKALQRLVRHAQQVNWGRSSTGILPPDDAAYAHFFERFLPENVRRSRIAQAAAVDASIRFVIGDDPQDDWLCRFDQGNLVKVARAQPQLHEDFGYRATHGAFWSAISGRVHPQELFLSGEAEIFGDAERALKMAMILNAFFREFPFDEEALLQHSQQRRSA